MHKEERGAKVLWIELRTLKKMHFKPRLRMDGIIWLDLEESCWKAGNALTCFSINRIGGRL
jgi:hypothetical protein